MVQYIKTDSNKLGKESLIYCQRKVSAESLKKKAKRSLLHLLMISSFCRILRNSFCRLCLYRTFGFFGRPEIQNKKKYREKAVLENFFIFEEIFTSRQVRLKGIFLLSSSFLRPSTASAV